MFQLSFDYTGESFIELQKRSFEKFQMQFKLKW